MESQEGSSLNFEIPTIGGAFDWKIVQHNNNYYIIILIDEIRREEEQETSPEKLLENIMKGIGNLQGYGNVLNQMQKATEDIENAE